MWKGLQQAIRKINEHMEWQIGNGKKINIWEHSWFPEVIIADVLNGEELPKVPVTLDNLIVGNSWDINEEMSGVLLAAGLDFHQLPYIHGGEDIRYWKLTNDGNFSIKTTYNHLVGLKPQVPWFKWVWNSYVHPNNAALVWKIILCRVPTDDRVIKMGVYITSRCYLCCSESEDGLHIIQGCRRVKAWWIQLANKFGFTINIFMWQVIFQLAAGSSAFVRKLWITWCNSLIANVWRLRTSKANDRTGSDNIMFLVLRDIKEAAGLIKGSVFTVQELQIIKVLGIQNNVSQEPKVIFASWCPPIQGVLKNNSDGCCLGRPGLAGAGVIIRNSENEVCGCIVKRLGISDSLCAEWEAATLSLEHAADRGFERVWLETDSEVVVKGFNNNKFPWRFASRIGRARKALTRLQVSHSFREANFAADYADKHAAHLPQDHILFYSNKPPFVKRLEIPFELYGRVKGYA